MPTESRFALRLPSTLYAAIKEAAAAKDYSMNEYIVWALTQFMLIREEHEQRIADLESKVAQLMREALQSPPAGPA